MEQLENRYLKQSLIPKRYLGDISLVPSKNDVKVFERIKEIRDDIVGFVNSGSNLFLYSNHVGNGKTTLATKLMKEYIKRISDKYYEYPALFINVNDFINNKKLAISNKELSAQVDAIESNMMKAKLVVLDDIGVKSISEYDSNLLYFWINYRTNNELSTIYTSNVTPDKLKGMLDERIYSRIINYSIPLELKDGDNRRA